MDQLKGAGCLFTQNNFVLAGYSPKLKAWTGIGGKINAGETVKEAAYRETIEELFGFTPSSQIVEECQQAFDFAQIITVNNYAIIPLSFDLVIHIIYILRAHQCTSPYYFTMPTSFIELINNRRPHENAEITELKVINYTQHTNEAKELIDDCKKCLRYMKKQQQQFTL
jgi:8-oxo-dGTP pyrophosphatase MutT (NUDIX family)